VALHLSGASGAGLLDPLRRAGWSTGSFHPLVAFPPAGALPPDLRGITVAIDGDAGARRFARAMASSLGAATLSLPARDRARYHLAACFASNYLVTLAAESVALLSGAGIGRARALRAILPLMRATLGNLEASGLAAGLTGPVVRGDDVTLRRHAAVLRRESAGLRELHGLLVRRTALLARSAGRLDAAALRRLDRALGRG
jgi:predicted short-subunit dehydrogenase-like oxidoreductase (DUF2520 family)